ncbi:MAG: HEAT repeat domain-containing protein [Deltaproteobacteria bacterium]|nr:HEAT repeat domain-containing protein [Deltaproteobacteria bacterium]
MSDSDRLVKLLSAQSTRVRTAAAVVVAELGIKTDPARAALLEMALGGDPAQQLPALEALAVVGTKKTAESILPLLEGGPREVRKAAVHALEGIGKSIVPLIKARLEAAGPEERRLLSEVLGSLGGKDAFSTLLDSFLDEDEEETRRAAVAARQTLRELKEEDRKTTLGQAKRFLTSKRAKESAAARAAAVKLIGYLEEPTTVPLLLEHAVAKAEAIEVRQEALLALRFALAKSRNAKDQSKLALELLSVIETAPPEVGRMARDTLAFVPLPSGARARLIRLMEHSDESIGLFALEALAGAETTPVSEGLVSVLLNTGGKRAERAAELLGQRSGAAAALGKALFEAKDEATLERLVTALLPHAGKLEARLTTRISKKAVETLEEDAKAAAPWLTVAFAADPSALAKQLRAGAAAHKKARRLKPATVLLEALCRTPACTTDDRYLLASLQLRQSARDPRSSARARDACLQTIERLAADGFDIEKALRADRSLDLEMLYYVGFHLLGEEDPIGAGLLETVVQKAGRKKIGRSAKKLLAKAAEL